MILGGLAIHSARITDLDLRPSMLESVIIQHSCVAQRSPSQRQLKWQGTDSSVLVRLLQAGLPPCPLPYCQQHFLSDRLFPHATHWKTKMSCVLCGVADTGDSIGLSPFVSFPDLLLHLSSTQNRQCGLQQIIPALALSVECSLHTSSVMQHHIQYNKHNSPCHQSADVWVPVR